MVAGGMVPPGDASTGSSRCPTTARGGALAAIRTGDTDYACVPIENSIDGSVLPTLDGLADGFRPADLRRAHPGRGIHHRRTRAGVAAADIETVRRVSGGRRAGPQVAGAPNSHTARIVPAYSNAAAAQDVAGGGADAGVSTALAAQRHGLAVLAADIVDEASARAPLRRSSARRGPAGPHRSRSHLGGPATGQRARCAGGGHDRTLDQGHRPDPHRIPAHPNRIGHLQVLSRLRRRTSPTRPSVRRSRRCTGAAADVRYLGSWPTGAAAGHRHRDSTRRQAWLQATRDGRIEHDGAPGAGAARTVLRQRRATPRHPATRCRADRSRPSAGARTFAHRLRRTRSPWWRTRWRPERVADRGRYRRTSGPGGHRVRKASTRFRWAIWRTATTMRRSTAFEAVYRQLASRRSRRPGARRGDRRSRCWTGVVPVLTELRLRHPRRRPTAHGDIVVVSHGAAIRLGGVRAGRGGRRLRGGPSPEQRRTGGAEPDHRRPLELRADGAR